jgi:hypothetical protein
MLSLVVRQAHHEWTLDPPFALSLSKGEHLNRLEFSLLQTSRRDGRAFSGHAATGGGLPVIAHPDGAPRSGRANVPAARRRTGVESVLDGCLSVRA